MASRKNRTINLALQGGGAHGAFAVGALDVLLQEPGLEIEAISATSAGAMNAVVMAHGMLEGGKEGAREALFKFWHDVSDHGKIWGPVKMTPWEESMGVAYENSASYLFFERVAENFSPYQFNPFNYNPLRDSLEKNVDFERLRKNKKLKLFISATNVKTGKIKIFDHAELCVEAVLASSCLPYIFQAAHVEDAYYWDGGYMGNPAIFPLIYHTQAQDILIIHINPIIREKLPKTVDEIKNRMSEVSFNSSLMREIRAIAFITKMLDDGWIKKEYRNQLKRVYLHSLRADESLVNFSVASKFNTQWNFLSELIDLGHQAGKRWLKEHFDDLGKRTTAKMEEYL